MPIVSREDIKVVLRTCKERTFTNLRDEAIIRIFCDTGMRLSEMAGLHTASTADGEQVPHIDLDQQIAWVLGKGRRWRGIALGARSTLAADRYLRARARHPYAWRPELWLGDRGRGPMTYWEDGSYDLAIGNVPFGAMVLHDLRHNRGGHSIHNHFIVKALHLVRPGGLVLVHTSRFTLDARNPAARREIAGLADLVSAVRLPSRTYQRAADTDVVTDLLVLRRREPGRQPDPTRWERTRLIELDGAQVPVNEYFLASPAAVLGEMRAVHGAYRDDDLVVRSAGDTIAALTRALEDLTASARERGLTWSLASPGAARSLPVAGRRSDEPDGYLAAHQDGIFTKVVSGTERPHEVPASQVAELKHLLALRDTVRSLLEAEAASAEDTPRIGALRAELGRLYDSYLQTYGPLNRFSLRRTGRTDPATGEPVMARIRPRQGGFWGPDGDPFASLVYALEQFDPVGQRTAKAAIFRERVIAPRAPRLGAESPDDALAICLDTCGEVRLGEIARLLGTTEEDARAQLAAALLAFIDRYNQTARPFNWTFTAADLARLLQRISTHPEPASLPEAA